MTAYLLRGTRALLTVTDFLSDAIESADRVVHWAARQVAKIGEFAHRASLDLTVALASRKALAAEAAANRAARRADKAKSVAVGLAIAADQASVDFSGISIAAQAEKDDLGL